MRSITDIRAFIQEGYRHFLPHLSIDCAVFGFHDNQLKVLLVKWKYLEGWCLPGGYIRRSEPVDEAAQRILEERTGIGELFLQQYHTFGGVDRTKGVSIEDFSAYLDVPIEQGNWLADRMVSIGYYALVEYSKVTPTPDYFSEECRWWDLREVPSLLFDHNLMVERALHTLRLQLHNQPIGYNLLPEKFTMPELQRLYETIIGKPLDRRNFQKKILSQGYLQRLEERKTIGAHKSPYQYQFDKQLYDKALAEGLDLGY